MTDAQRLGMMIERESAKAWEDLNEEDPHRAAAEKFLRLAADLCMKVEQALIDAAMEIRDNPEALRIESLADGAEEIAVEIRAGIRRL